MYLHHNFLKTVAMTTANFPGRHLTPHFYESFAIAPGTSTL